MRFRRAEAALAGLFLAVCACSTSPSPGSTTTGSTTGTGGTGGKDGGVCTKVHKGYVCGHCEDCLEAHCCAELDLCASEIDCFYCVFAGYPYDAGHPDCTKVSEKLGKEAQALRECMQQFCTPQCYSQLPTGTGGKGDGAGGNCGGNGESGGTGGSGGNPH